MSGFAGVISLDGAPPDRDLLRRMADVLKFRGPDAINIVVQPGAGFVFTFLRTGPAPQCSSQPCTLDGRVWLIGDIRLDGRDDLRLRLEQHGDRFDAEPTDEELVLRAWRRWGEKALPDLIGDYAFTIWDSEARRLVCARDLIGGRPFFYARAKGWFYFSNTLNAIRSSPAISAELDPHFIGDFLLQGSCSDLERSAFRDISRLRAGFAIQFCDAGARESRFASIPIKEPLWLKQEQEYVDQFRALLEQAVADRLPRDSVAIYMSGGLDSTSLTATALKVAEEDSLPLSVRSYCVDCSSLFDDQEGRLASRVAEYLNIPVHIFSDDSCLPFSDWPLEKSISPEPSAEPYLPSLLKQDRTIAQHASVVFLGYGGDGVLTGQTWPFLVDLFRQRQPLRLVQPLVSYIRKKRRFPPLRGGFRTAIWRLVRRPDPMADYPQWLAPPFESELGLRQRWRDLSRPVDKPPHPWYPLVYSLWQEGYWSSVLEAQDAAWTHAPLERRVPFLDLRVLGFLLSVPPVPLCIDKELLRRAMRGMLPDEVLHRPKTPLAGDPLRIQRERGDWQALPLPPPSSTISNFVDWQKLVVSFRAETGSSLWRDSQPLLLDLWLKAIETT